MKNKLSPIQVLETAFDNFGLEKGDKIINQNPESSETLSSSSCMGFYSWHGFSGKTKTVWSSGKAYELWLGETCTRENHRSQFSLWFASSGNQNLKDKENIDFANYLIRNKIDSGESHSFCATLLDNLSKWFMPALEENPIIVARAYPQPERTDKGRYLDSHLWHYSGDEQRLAFPLEKIPEQYQREIRKIKERLVQHYSADAIQYIVNHIRNFRQ